MEPSASPVQRTPVNSLRTMCILLSEESSGDPIPNPSHSSPGFTFLPQERIIARRGVTDSDPSGLPQGENCLEGSSPEGSPTALFLILEPREMLAPLPAHINSIVRDPQDPFLVQPWRPQLLHRTWAKRQLLRVLGHCQDLWIGFWI